MKLRTLVCLLGCIVIGLSAPTSAGAEEGSPTPGPTKVEIAVVVLDLERIDDAAQGFSASVFFVASWRDPRLTHDGPEVTPDGTATYRQRVMGQFSQKLDLGDFPLDRQTLAIQMVAVGYSQDEIIFANHPEFPSGVVPEISISDWRVL